MNNIIQQGCNKCIKLIKSDSKDIYTNHLFDILFQINYVLLKFLFIKKEYWKKLYHSFHKILAAQQFLTLIIRNVSWAPNQHIQIISEGWSNGC